MTAVKLCPVFCLLKDVQIDDYCEMIDWAYKNKDEKTVLILDENDVWLYQTKGLWEVIANETGNHLFGLYEDDWIFDFNVMQNIINSISRSDLLVDENIGKILFILNYAITNKKSVVFHL
ncbi:DMP12 family DNA mimic protein [Moraxella nasibovis]|uniref:DMP12 family DNA mimic protein n=1 Tax=Moraxella nasibovis TaxID=2904120 RepID=UPI00240F6EFD|nr:DMP12 family DNA mimic protein [Moraxella nasibovis]WFF39397.1 DMP12 family DNA mimic protein [Moraxella nasibovis]